MNESAFTTSSPSTRPAWCDSVGTWRVAHADRLLASLQELASVDTDVYVVHHTDARNGAKRLFAGYRDNRDAEAHAGRCAALISTMRAAGLKVRVCKLDGRVAGAVITDTWSS